MFVCSIAHLSFLKLHIFISKGNIMLFQIWPLCQCNVRFRLELSGTHEFYLYWLKCWNRLGFIFVKLWYLKMTLDQNGHCCGIPNPPISPNETHEWLINLCHMALSHNGTTAWLYTFTLCYHPPREYKERRSHVLAWSSINWASGAKSVAGENNTIFWWNIFCWGFSTFSLFTEPVKEWNKSTIPLSSLFSYIMPSFKL